MFRGSSELNGVGMDSAKIQAIVRHLREAGGHDDIGTVGGLALTSSDCTNKYMQQRDWNPLSNDFAQGIDLEYDRTGA